MGGCIASRRDGVEEEGGRMEGRVEEVLLDGERRDMELDDKVAGGETVRWLEVVDRPVGGADV